MSAGRKALNFSLSKSGYACLRYWSNAFDSGFWVDVKRNSNYLSAEDVLARIKGTHHIIRQSVDSFMADLWDFQSTLDFLAIAILSSPSSFDLEVIDGQ